jgi:hypothetical protein
MTTNNFDIETWNKIKKFEFLHDVNMKGGWQVDFTNALKKIREREKYDKVWELIKKKNNW